MTRSVMAQFIKNELNAYIATQRAYSDPVTVNLIMRAIEAYEEYRRLVSSPESKPKCNCKCNAEYGQNI